MSDAKLRELERKWKESGSVEDEAAYLRERVRVGDLTQERLELAAYCGHGAASLALGTHMTAQYGPAWTSDLIKRYGKRSAIFLGIVAAEELLPHLDSESAFHIQSLSRAGRSWVACPCVRHANSFMDASPWDNKVSDIVKEFAALPFWCPDAPDHPVATPEALAKLIDSFLSGRGLNEAHLREKAARQMLEESIMGSHR